MLHPKVHLIQLDVVEYNPNFCFVSVTINNQPCQLYDQLQMFSHLVNIVHFKIKIWLQIALFNSTPYPRWNFYKAAWEDYAN